MLSVLDSDRRPAFSLVAYGMIPVFLLQIPPQGPGRLVDLGNLISASLMELLSQHAVRAHLRIRGEASLPCWEAALAHPSVWRQVQSCSGFHPLFSTACAVGSDESLLPGD